MLENNGFDSVKGLGKLVPEPIDYTIIDGVKIPNGKMVQKTINTSLRYNEYIVYDVKQLLIKYLVVVKNIGNYSVY